jgi:hypothetical protein
MDAKDAKALKVALQALMHSVNVPTHLAANIADAKLRELVGALASEVASKIDYEILPYLYSQHPELKADD